MLELFSALIGLNMRFWSRYACRYKLFKVSVRALETETNTTLESAVYHKAYNKCNLALDDTRERKLFRKSFRTGRLHSDFAYERGRTARTSCLLNYANFHILFKTFRALTGISSC